MSILLFLRPYQVSGKLMSCHGVCLLYVANLQSHGNALINMLEENKMALKKYNNLIHINLYLYGIGHNFQYEWRPGLPRNQMDEAN